MAGRVKPEPTTEKLIAAVFDALDNLDAWVDDCSDVDRLIAVRDALPDVTARVNLVSGSATKSLRALLVEGPRFLPDGRTVAIGVEPRRTLLPSGRAIIRNRAISKAMQVAQGEMGPALETLAEIYEETYLSPSTMPKWGGLKALGFNSWDDVAETGDVEKGITIT